VGPPETQGVECHDFLYHQCASESNTGALHFLILAQSTILMLAFLVGARRLVVTA
jgi:hypothetical protein